MNDVLCFLILASDGRPFPPSSATVHDSSLTYLGDMLVQVADHGDFPSRRYQSRAGLGYMLCARVPHRIPNKHDVTIVYSRSA